MLMMFLAGMPSAWAQTSQPVRVSLHASEIPLGTSVEILEDPSGQLTAATLPTKGAWRPHPEAASLNFGFSTSAWWARVQVRNTEPQAVTRVLDMDSSLLDHVEVDVQRADGRITMLMRSGDRLPFATRSEAVRSFATRLQLQAGEQVTLLMRFASHDGLNEIVTPTLYAPEAFTAHVQSQTIAYGIYFGVLGTVLAYNLFLFITTRQASFGYYMAYLSSFLVWGLIFRGYAFQYWWPDSPNFNNQALAVAVSMLYLTLGLFLMSYLKTRRTMSPSLHKLVALCTAANGIGILPAFFNLYLSTFLLNTVIGLCLIFSLITTGAVALRKGSREARYFALAFAILTIAALLYYLRMIDVVPANSFTDNLLQVGSAAECLLLAFGLADQMNMLKTQKLHAERRALAAQTALNTELESLVSSRTQALEAANERLAKLSITDELTGAYNRRQFNKDLAAAVALHARHHTPLALCLLDVDHFKLYNDRYGHLGGDECLRQVSRALAQVCNGASAMLARWGGEEFVVALPDAHEHALAGFAQRLCESVQQLAMPHDRSPTAGCVTISVGGACSSQCAAASPWSEVLELADQALYRAKQDGRNRFKLAGQPQIVSGSSRPAHETPE